MATTFRTSPGAHNSIASSLQATMRKRTSVPFTPWQAPTSPPAGSYDPSLGHVSIAADGTLVGSGGVAGQAQRGYDNLYGDVSDQNARDGAELGYTVQGLQRQKGRTLADLLTSKTREQENYAQATTDLGTNYARLGDSQAGNAIQAGVGSGGTFAAALAARTVNQQHDQSGLDQQHTRAVTDNDLAVTRTNEDYGEDDLGAIGQARRQEGYSVADRLKQVAGAGIENQSYQTDLGDQRWYQASQAGYAPPARGTPGGPPANEFPAPDGSAYRIVVRGTRRYRVTPDGNEEFVGTRPKARAR